MTDQLVRHTETFLRSMFTSGDLCHLRALECRRGEKILSGLYDDPCEAARDAQEISEHYLGQVFYALNPVDPASPYARRHKRLNSYDACAETLSAKSVLKRKRILVDLDPVRPAGCCSTQAEKASAFSAAEIITQYLASEGWPEAHLADSGNGAHLLIDTLGPLENECIQAFLGFLQTRLLDRVDGVKIDPKVADLPRIARLPGCRNRKGDHTPERPHRIARVVCYPDAVVPVSADMVLGLARKNGYLPPSERPVSEQVTPGEKITAADVTHLIEHDYPQYLACRTTVNKDGDTYFHLSKCPIENRPHTGAGGATTCSTLILKNGEMIFKCFGCETGFYKLIKHLIEATGKRPTNKLFEAAPPEIDVAPYHGKWAVSAVPEPAPEVKPKPAPAASGLPAMQVRPRLYLDYETYSEADIDEGYSRYIGDPSFEAILLSYAYGGGDVTVLDLTCEPLPDKLRADLHNPKLQKVAWNATFEMLVTSKICEGRKIDTRQWFDPQILSRYQNVPNGGSLGGCCAALEMEEDLAKDKDGKSLVKLFCAPQKQTKKNIKAGMPATFRATAASHPEKWELFRQYNPQDVVALREATRRLEAVERLPLSEYTLWRLDQAINSRGIPLDLAYIHGAMALMAKSDASIIAQLKEITLLENPNSNTQMKAWCKLQGCEMVSLDEDHIAAALESDALPEDVRQVFKLKQILGGSGPKKLPKMLSQIDPGGCIRHQLQFYGASQTGRWSARGVQVQNMPRPSKAMEDRIEEMTDLIRSGQQLPEGTDIADAVTSTIRSAIRAPEGYKLISCDYSSIESRTLAWMTECPSLTQVFIDKLDSYKISASAVYHIPYDQVTKSQRNDVKGITLGGGYGLGPKTLRATAKAAYGVELTEREAQAQIAAFKRLYPEIPLFWGNLESAVKRAIRKRGKETIKCLTVDGTRQGHLSIRLPSGRLLHYPEIRIEQQDGADYSSISYNSGLSRSRIWGSAFVANINQSVARDLLAFALLECEKAGLDVRFSAHDEVLCIARDEDAEEVRRKLHAIMNSAPDWLSGLVLACEAKISQFFRK